MPFLSSTTGTYGYGRNSVVGTDIFYDQTELLLHMDGENGGTTFTDDSSYARTGITATGGLTTNTSVFKF
jgi:hypothetical protein